MAIDSIRSEGVDAPSEEAMKQLVLVCLGSAVGGGARYLLSGWVSRTVGSAFPFGTLAVNLIGSLLIGAIMYAGTEASVVSPTVRIMLTVGLLGGFTTFSAFSFETMRQLQDGAFEMASVNVLASVVGCVFCCLLGWLGCRWLFPA
jgi:CrcB protein